MNYLLIFTRNRGESEQPVASGQVPEMLWHSHTLNSTTGWRYEYQKPAGDRLYGARPTSGRGQTETERLEQEIGELEAEYRDWINIAKNRQKQGDLIGYNEANWKLDSLGETLRARRRELAAFFADLALRTLPSPASEGGPTAWGPSAKRTTDIP